MTVVENVELFYLFVRRRIRVCGLFAAGVIGRTWLESCLFGQLGFRGKCGALRCEFKREVAQLAEIKVACVGLWQMRRFGRNTRRFLQQLRNCA